MTRPIDVVNSWWSMFTRGNFDNLPSLVAEHAEISMPGGMRMRG